MFSYFRVFVIVFLGSGLSGLGVLTEHQSATRGMQRVANHLLTLLIFLQHFVYLILLHVAVNIVVYFDHRS